MSPTIIAVLFHARGNGPRGVWSATARAQEVQDDRREDGCPDGAHDRLCGVERGRVEHRILREHDGNLSLAHI